MSYLTPDQIRLRAELAAAREQNASMLRTVTGEDLSAGQAQLLLEQARAGCDRLIVGLNSDASVRRLKGATRPVQPEAARAAVLASLATVDLVCIFDDDTPEALIRELRPDLLVKGADYREDEVVGADLVQSWGGKVLLAEIIAGESTSATLARIRS